MAPFEIVLNGHLPASPGRVWALLVDHAAVPCWLEGVSAVVSGGDEFLVLAGGAADQAWVLGEVIEVEPRRRLVIRLDDPAANLCEVRVGWSIVPDEAGTRFELRVTGVPGVFGTLLAPLLRLRAEVAMARAVRGFRAALEARGEGGRDPADAPCPEREARRAEMARAAATV